MAWMEICSTSNFFFFVVIILSSKIQTLELKTFTQYYYYCLRKCASAAWRSIIYSSFITLLPFSSILIIFISFLPHFYLQFKEITYGLQRTNASTLLRSCLEYVMNYSHRFLPGEGGYLLDLLQNVSIFRFSFIIRISVKFECISHFFFASLSWELHETFYDTLRIDTQSFIVLLMMLTKKKLEWIGCNINFHQIFIAKTLLKLVN